MPSQEFKVTTSGITLTPDSFQRLVDWALRVEAGRMSPAQVGPVTVSVEEAKVPRVVAVVEDGMAEIRAVDGMVDIVLVDLDLEGDELDSDDIETKLTSERHEGVAADFDAAIIQAREGLEKYLEEGAELQP